MAKFVKQSLCTFFFFFDMTLPRAHAHYICTVCATEALSSCMHYLNSV